MRRRVHPGWLVAFFALVIWVSVWLPWLRTSGSGGGWASAIGGTYGSLVLPSGFGLGQLITLLSSVLLVVGAAVGRGLSLRLASIAALVISVLLAVLTVTYYQHNVHREVAAEYGLYVGAFGAACAVLCSLWAAVSAFAGTRRAR